MGWSLLLLHSAILFFSTWKGLEKIRWPKDLKVQASFLCWWANIVASTYLCGAFHLNHLDVLWLGVSFGLQLLFFLLLRHRSWEGSPALPPFRSLWTEARKDAPVFLILLGLCWFGSLLLALFNPLQVPDTVAMKLPNAYFYLQDGGLLAPRHLWDEGRGFSVPFNSTFLWMYFLRWTDATRPLLLTAYTTGVLCCLALFRLSTLLKVSARSSAILVATFGCSAILLSHMSTDNDDLLGSLPTVQALLFLTASIQASRAPFLLALAGLGIGVAQGSKGFPALLAPVVFLWFAYQIFYNGAATRAYLREKWGEFASATVLSFSFCVPYFITLYKEYGKFQLSPPLFDIGLIKPFSLTKTIYNLCAYHAQMLFSWIPDLIKYRPFGARQTILDFFNQKLLPWLLPPFGENRAFPWDPFITDLHLYDHTFWYGPLGTLLMLAILFCLVRRKFQRPWFWLALGYCSWAFIFASQVKFTTGIARYWFTPVSVALPILAVTYDGLLNHSSRWLRNIPYIVFGLTVFLGVKALFYTELRNNLMTVWKQDFRAKDFESTPELEALMQDPQKPVNILSRIYAWPFYNFARNYPGHRISFANKIKEGHWNIIPAYMQPVLNVPGYKTDLPIPVGREKWGQVNSLGFSETKAIFGTRPYAWPAEELEKAFPGAWAKAERYVFLSLIPSRPRLQEDRQIETHIEWPFQGANKLPFEYRFSLVEQGGVPELLKDWSREGGGQVMIPVRKRTLFRVELRDAQSPQKISIFEQKLTGDHEF